MEGTVKFQLEVGEKGFPGGALGGNLPANAGDTGLIPGPGRFPHAAEQLGPCATTTEPAL